MMSQFWQLAGEVLAVHIFTLDGYDVTLGAAMSWALLLWIGLTVVGFLFPGLNRGD